MTNPTQGLSRRAASQARFVVISVIVRASSNWRSQMEDRRSVKANAGREASARLGEAPVPRRSREHTKGGQGSEVFMRQVCVRVLTENVERGALPTNPVCPHEHKWFSRKPGPLSPGSWQSTASRPSHGGTARCQRRCGLRPVIAICGTWLVGAAGEQRTEVLRRETRVSP